MVRNYSNLLFGISLTNGTFGQASNLSFRSFGVGEAAASVRVVGADGAAANVGLLQVRMQGSHKNEFGSVCGMNLAAADVVCSQLGYDFGSLGSSACDRYGGNNLCGVPGSIVAMADLTCSGGELDIEECSYTSPSTSCLGHELDAIVFCGLNFRNGVDEGASRLIDADGAPSVDGIGRLEIFHEGAWGPVCRSGFTGGAANVACKAMGYAGAAALENKLSCRDVSKRNYCGDLAASLGEVSCSGQEANILECSHEKDDNVYCAPEESVVIHCNGEGNAQGRGRQSAASTAGGVQ